MSIETDPSAQILRVALITPLVAGVGIGFDVPAPFIGAMLHATLALKMPVPPPFRQVVLLALLLLLLPTVFSTVAGVLNEFPYLMVGFVGLVLFYGFRLQSAPRTALLGVLTQTFGIMMPLLADQSDRIADLASGVLGLNVVLALVGLYLGFAIFPAPLAGTQRIVPPEPIASARRRTWDAAISALIMLPLVSVLLVLDLLSAVRMLFTVATVLAALGRREAFETGSEILMSVLVAGVAAIGFTFLHVVWKSPVAIQLSLCLLGLIVVPYAFKGPHKGAVTLAVPLVWILLGTSGEAPALQTMIWTGLSALGVGYAVGIHSLLAPGPRRQVV